MNYETSIHDRTYLFISTVNSSCFCVDREIAPFSNIYLDGLKEFYFSKKVTNEDYHIYIDKHPVYLYIPVAKLRVMKDKHIRKFIDQAIAFYPLATRYYICLSDGTERKIKCDDYIDIAKYCSVVSDQIQKEIEITVKIDYRDYTPKIEEKLFEHGIRLAIICPAIKEENHVLDRDKVEIYKKFSKVYNNEKRDAIISVDSATQSIYETLKVIHECFSRISITHDLSRFGCDDDLKYDVLQHIYYELYYMNRLEIESFQAINLFKKLILGNSQYSSFFCLNFRKRKTFEGFDGELSTLALDDDGRIYTSEKGIGMHQFYAGSVYDGIDLVATKCSHELIKDRPTCEKCTIRHVCGGRDAVESIKTFNDHTIVNTRKCAFLRKLFESAAVLVYAAEIVSKKYSIVMKSCTEKYNRYFIDEDLFLVYYAFEETKSFSDLIKIRDTDSVRWEIYLLHIKELRDYSCFKEEMNQEVEENKDLC